MQAKAISSTATLPKLLMPLSLTGAKRALYGLVNARRTPAAAHASASLGSSAGAGADSRQPPQPQQPQQQPSLGSHAAVNALGFQGGRSGLLEHPHETEAGTVEGGEAGRTEKLMTKVRKPRLGKGGGGLLGWADGAMEWLKEKHEDSLMEGSKGF